MALDYKKKKNLIRSPDEYTRYYGNFRGVDFSSEETEVNEQRFAYAVNMYKDYRSSEGNAIETIPGFRRRFEIPRAADAKSRSSKWETIYGIHEYTYYDDNNQRQSIMIVHAGTKLYAWDRKHSVNALQSLYVEIPESLVIDMEYCTLVNCIEFPFENAKFPNDTDWTLSEGKLTLNKNVFGKYVGKDAIIRYFEGTLEYEQFIMGNMATNESKSFTFNNRLYILDGHLFLVVYRDGENLKVEHVADPVSRSRAYCPTTYRAIPCVVPEPSTDNTNNESVDPDIALFQNISEFEYEQKNLINSSYRHTYNVPENCSKLPVYSEDEIMAVGGYDLSGSEIWLTKATSETNNQYKIVTKVDGTTGSSVRIIEIFRDSIPPKHIVGGMFVYYRKDASTREKDIAKIEKCTNFATFDNRIFLTGNPDYPNLLFYCGNNNETGLIDPTYFGELDYVQDGVEEAPITGLITVADTLAVLKNNAKQDSSIYFHTRMETNEGVAPITYPSQPGLSGVGCLGACVNFLDDPIFISPLGVEAIGQLSVRLERAVEHRSSLIDAKLTSMDLSKAKFAEWDGYLVLLLPGGKMFLADSRQRYTHSSGVMQYEWYYIEGVGVYEEDVNEEGVYQKIVPEYYYSEYDEDAPASVTLPDVGTYEAVAAKNIYDTESMTVQNLINSPVKFDVNGSASQPTIYDVGGYKYVINHVWDGQNYEPKAVLCEYRGSNTGGVFHEATHIVNIDRNLYFGTGNGVICAFNFDLFDDDGKLSQWYYAFDDRTIRCGVATKLDNCGIPHLTKSTIKKSTVLKTKSMYGSAVKIRVRTNNKSYESIARVSNAITDFEHTDFSNYSFDGDRSIFSIKEKEKHWVEKQHWIYSDEFERPFAVHYLAFRYKVSGRIKG